MRHAFSTVVIACGLLALTSGYREVAAAGPAPPVAFIDVNVISMQRDEVRQRQTVIVEGGRISAVGSTASIRPPQAEFGTVDVGKRADLLLLEANPLSDIGNIKQRAGVMLRGRWLPETALRERLAEIERRVAQ